MDEDSKRLAEAADIIGDHLWWKGTPEGHDYWENVYCNLRKRVHILEKEKANAPVTISGLTVSSCAEAGTVNIYGGAYTHLSPDDARALGAELIRRADG